MRERAGARGRRASAVDIFIEADTAARFNAFGLIDGAASRLQSTRNGLHPRLRHQIGGEAIRVF